MKNIEKSYSIILPTYNEVGHIEDLVFKIHNIFSSKNVVFEIIIVDDNSTDGTIDIIYNLERTYKNILGIIRENKKGSLVGSLNDGISKSKYENIIWMDADFSHPPEYLRLFLENRYFKYDVIVFSRFLKDSKRYFSKKNVKPKLIDNLSIILNKVCKLLLFKTFTDYSSGFICIKKNTFNNYKLKGYYGDYFIRLISYCFIKNLKVIELPYTELDRKSGYSKTTINKLNFFIKSFNYLLAIGHGLILKIFNKF